MLNETIRAESGLNTNINFQNNLSENSNIHYMGKAMLTSGSIKEEIKLQ